MANSVHLDQTAPLGAVWSGSALFAQAYLSENLRSLRYSFGPNLHSWILVLLSTHVSKVRYFEFGKNSTIWYFFWMVMYLPHWLYIIVDVFPSVCEPLVSFRLMHLKRTFAGVSLMLNASISLFQSCIPYFKISIRPHFDFQYMTPSWKCVDVTKTLHMTKQFHFDIILMWCPMLKCHKKMSNQSPGFA